MTARVELSEQQHEQVKEEKEVYDVQNHAEEVFHVQKSIHALRIFVGEIPAEVDHELAVFVGREEDLRVVDIREHERQVVEHERRRIEREVGRVHEHEPKSGVFHLFAEHLDLSHDLAREEIPRERHERQPRVFVFVRSPFF